MITQDRVYLNKWNKDWVFIDVEYEPISPTCKKAWVTYTDLWVGKEKNMLAFLDDKVVAQVEEELMKLLEEE